MTGKVTLERLEARREELRTIYQELDFQRRAVFLGNWEASLQRPSPVDFQRVAQVEDLVLLIEMDQRPAFTVTPRFKKWPEIHANPAGEILLNLDEVCQFRVDPKHRLSPRVRMFLEVSHQWRQNTPLLRTLQKISDAQELALRKAEVLNSLADAVREALVGPEFRRELNKEQGIANRRYQEASRYVEDLCRSVGEILVIPLQLNVAYELRMTVKNSGSRAGLPAIVEWFNAFKVQARHRVAMKDVVGIVGCWEHSQHLGVFARVLFFMDAARVPNGKEAADAIGNCWIEFTEGKGSYSPSYLTSAYHDKLLTAVQVGRGKSRARRQLLEVALRYLTQQELVFRDWQLDFDRFFRGEIRRAQKSKGDSRRSSVKEATKVSAVAVDLAGDGEPALVSIDASAGALAPVEADGAASPQPDIDSSPADQAPSGATEPIPPRPQPSLESHRPRPKMVVVPRRNRIYIEKPRDEESGEA